MHHANGIVLSSAFNQLTVLYTKLLESKSIFDIEKCGEPEYEQRVFVGTHNGLYCA